MTTRRFAARVVATSALLLSAAPSRAQAPDAEACAASFEKAQELRAAAKLVDARREARVCSSSSCPEVISGPCVKWVAELEAETPTVVLAVRDSAGHDVLAASVLLDGTPLENALGGTPIALDPGPHKLRVEASDDATIARDLEVVIRVGERNRIVELTLPTKGGAPPVTGPQSGPSGLWIGAAVSWALGGAGLITGAVGGAIALDRQGNLDCPTPTTCAPGQRGDIDDMYAAAHASTAGFVVGGVGVVVAVILTALAATEEPTTKAGDLRFYASPRGLGVAF
ncbi:MAG: hypothetical protein U0271_05230 [Polyangiaceae bacterium]